MHQPEWTHEDLGRLSDALTTLSQLGIRNVIGLWPGGVAKCRVDPESLAALSRAVGFRPEVRPGQYGGAWDAHIDVGGYRVAATFIPETLPLIGYQVTPLPPQVMPVPIEEGAVDG